MAELTHDEMIEENRALRKRIQELEQSLGRVSAAEVNWREMLANAPDTVLIMKPDGTIRYINRANPGATVDQVLGTNALDYVLPDHRDGIVEYVREVLKTGEFRRFEVPAVDQSGKTFWYAVRMGPFIENEKTVGVTCIATDNTARVQAERTRQEIERRLDTLCSISPVGILRFDMDGNCVYMNRRACEIAGRSTEGLLGDGWIEAIHEDDREKVLDGWLQKSNSEGPYQTEHRIALPNGTVRWVYAQTIAETNESEKVVGYVKIMTDITDRKRDEERLKAEEQLLRKLIDLQERERTLIAHDIHDGFVQDVVGAKMQLESACYQLESLPDGPPKSLVEVSELLGRAIKEARRMISELRPLIIDEQGVVEAINYLVHDERFCQGLTVVYEHKVQFDRLDPMLEGALYRIVQEALTNVVRHSRSPLARVRLEQNDHHLRLEIQDEGVGFDKAGVPKDRFGIRGIRERARLFGGHARITSEPHKGTHVVAEIPLVDVPPANSGK